MFWKELLKLICIAYKESFVVESGYFFDLCHWNGFLLSLVIFHPFLYIFLIRGEGATGREQLGAEKSHWQVQKMTLAGSKSHTSAKMSHWSVIIMVWDHWCWMDVKPLPASPLDTFHAGESKRPIAERTPNSWVWNVQSRNKTLNRHNQITFPGPQKSGNGMNSIICDPIVPVCL